MNDFGSQRTPAPGLAPRRTGKLRAYRETFRRHRVLLIMPIVIAAAVAGWFTFSPPPAYQSSAHLWVDNGGSIPSSLAAAITSAAGATSASESAQFATGGSAQVSATGAAAEAGPAALEAEVVSELLLAPAFDTAVERGTRLEPGAFRSEEVPFRPYDVSAVALGPQVLKLSYTGASPNTARVVLESLIRELGVAGTAFGESIGKTVSAYYRHDLIAANSIVAGNRGSLATYSHAHPKANSQNDGTFRTLASQLQLAQSQLASVQAESQQADAEARHNGGSATLATLDPPSLPRSAVAGLGTKLMGIVGGALAGAIVSLLALLASTPRPPTRWDDDVPFFARLAAWDKRGWRVRSRSARSPAVHPAARRPELHPRRESA